jgi:N-acetylmuramoyl-L-alanine amidase
MLLLLALLSSGLLLFGTTGAIAADLEEPHHVTAVRFWSLGGVTRIAIETDGDFQVKTDHLDNPDRIFFDLAGTKPALTHKSMTVIPVADRFVKQIRVAEPQRNVTRVVLDLETTVEATTSRLENPDRLIIELRAPGGELRAPGSEPRAPGGKGKGTETTQEPVKTPPALVEPTPAAKPVEHRQFTPPPTAVASAAPVRAQEATLDPPPELPAKTAAVPASANAFVNSRLNYKPGPAPPRPTATALLAKATAPAVIPPALSESAPPAETALPAKRNSSGDRSMIRVLGLKVGRIVLDPGHGGHDTGTVGPEGLREKDLVLDVAQRLGRLIEEKMGSEVIYTRSDDTFVALERRTEIANEAKADLFLSIHANSSPLRTAAGVETFYLNFTTSKSVLDLAARENAGSQMSVYELQALLEKIALKDKVEESREFAARVQSALYTLSARPADARSKDRGVKKAPFVVLIGAAMPSVLAEIGFISNAHDESIMRREEYRQRTAEALYKGLSSYASSLSHFQVAQRH